MNRNKRELTDEQRRMIYDDLQYHSGNGKLKRGMIKCISEKFSVSTQTVSKIWKRGQSTRPSNVLSLKKGQVGRKKKNHLLAGRICNVPLNKRKTIRSLAGALNMPKSSLHDQFKNGSLRRCTSALKPTLTAANKKERVLFALQHMHFFQNGIIEFTNMYDVIHIDEKWFYLTEDNCRYYLELDEPEPHRQVKSKRFITKVMFLAAVARPRLDPVKNEFFDGKIGIWPFIKYEPAKRNSKNRCAGTEVASPVVVDKNEYRQMLINKVLPAIKSKWPCNRVERRRTIFLQQDNAKPHITPSDPVFVEKAISGEFDIRLTCQPPNSPDMNILDLGYFRAIQSAYYSENPNNIEDIIQFVKQSFDNMPPNTLNKVFLTLQNCMIESIKVKGGNNYRLPHMAKDCQSINNTLPDSLRVLPETLADAFEELNQ